MGIIDRVRAVAEPVAHAKGVRLINVTFGREGPSQVLRLVIDRQSGPTTVADCEAVSRAVSAALDTADAIPHAYTLEVSSAGKDTPLWKRPA